MKISAIMRALISCFSLMIIINPVAAKGSAEYAEMGKASWSAFECAVYAEKSKNSEEQGRLFIHGYNQGKLFIEAIKSKKIEAEDISKRVPLYMPMLLSGPSTDFMLGRIYEFIVNDVYDEISKDNYTEIATTAENLFWKKNCKLIGK